MMSGTSMSIPHDAGIAALLLSENPSLTVEEVRQIIRRSADDLLYPFGTGPSYPGWDIYSGYGMLDAEAAVQRALGDQCEANLLMPTVNFHVADYHRHNPLDAGRFYFDGLVLLNALAEIRGTADATGFHHLVLEVGEGTNPATWQTLLTSSQPVHDDVLLPSWDTTSLAAGIHTLRLRVFDSTGEVCDDRVHIESSFAKLTSPPPNNLHLPWDTIRGFAWHPDFQQWSLWYGVGENPVSWSLISQSSSPMPGSGSVDVLRHDELLLESLEGIVIPDGIVTLRLVVDATSGPSLESRVVVEFDGTHLPFQEGWPVSAGGFYAMSPVVIHDLDSDGSKELLYGLGSSGSTSLLYVRESDGSVYPGWPVATAGARIHASPTVGDVDGDGTPEIGIKTHDFENFYVYVFEVDGSVMPGWPKTFGVENLDFNGEVTGASLVFADLNDDRKLDVVLSNPGAENTLEERLFAFDSDGTNLPGWPVQLQNRSFTPLAVGDVNNDDLIEIVLETNAGELMIFDSGGQMLSSWSFEQIPQDRSGPVLADFDGDGDLEIVTSGCTQNLYMWDHLGTPMSGWPVQLDDSSGPQLRWTGSPIIGDVDGDSKPDVVISSTQYDDASASLVSRVHAYSADGTPLPGWPKTYSLQEVGDLYYAGILADVSNDGMSNYVIGPWRNLHNRPIYVFDKFGDLVGDSNFPFRQDSYYYSSPAVDDLDGDGDLEMAFVENGGGEVLVWDLETPTTTRALAWPMFQHDAQHTGVYVPAAVSVLFVAIDIKPGGFPNSINPRSRGVIPVAILGTENFDVADVDVATLRFGPEEAQPRHNGHLEDVNFDGIMDLMLHFRMRDTGIQCGDIEATLTGSLLTGQPIEGTDSIGIVGCKR
jgi:hypothetical protein